jgi:hypothetical protein
MMRVHHHDHHRVYDVDLVNTSLHHHYMTHVLLAGFRQLACPWSISFHFFQTPPHFLIGYCVRILVTPPLFSQQLVTVIISYLVLSRLIERYDSLTYRCRDT